MYSSDNKHVFYTYDHMVIFRDHELINDHDGRKVKVESASFTDSTIFAGLETLQHTKELYSSVPWCVLHIQSALLLLSSYALHFFITYSMKVFVIIYFHNVLFFPSNVGSESIRVQYSGSTLSFHFSLA